VRGPANRPKDGASPLEGVVETDWAVAPFAMNWKLTRPGLEVTFAADEPICMLVPVRLADLESFDAELASIQADGGAARGYAAWERSRTMFIASGGRMTELTDAPDRREDQGSGTSWQKHYFHGRAPGGETSNDHRTRLRLARFGPVGAGNGALVAPVEPAERVDARTDELADEPPSDAGAFETEREEIRPLVSGFTRWTDDAVEIDTGRHEVRIEGDLDLARAVIGNCDGRRSVRELVELHGPDGAELITELIASGALVDCTQSWRAFHRQGSVGTALGRPLDEQGVLALQQMTFRPSGTCAADVALQVEPCTTLTLSERRRSSFPVADGITPSFAQLSSVLAGSYRFRLDSGAPSAVAGSVASAGALYPLIVHVLIRTALPEVPTGLWWYDPTALRLERIRDDRFELGSLFLPNNLSDALLAKREPVVFVSADLGRPTRKYGARGYRYALIEAGALLQAATLVATELGLPVRPIGGFDDGQAHRFLDLPASAVCLLGLSLGC
jgi:SagB-type dehydrogenase family enzyme